MSKRLIIILAIVLVMSFGLVMARKLQQTKPGEPLKLTLTTLPNVAYTTSHIPLKVTFENVSDRDVRILSAFKKPELSYFFFRPHLKASDGTPIQTVGGGKVAFNQGSMDYIVLKRGDKTDVTIDLSKFLPAQNGLKAGDYECSVSYQNQYGTGFRGQIESDTIKLNLVEQK